MTVVELFVVVFRTSAASEVLNDVVVYRLVSHSGGRMRDRVVYGPELLQLSLQGSVSFGAAYHSSLRDSSLLAPITEGLFLRHHS
ncbi:hypothetical protein E2C01_022235 [Portunus trituberculatus]|uniref:Secreted protein n=1 Tax=Portunus trituberculatus TaxID=210409 RepID=A0A5B7E6H6_PORTR|nr:hypothetical protein [Portunus trituberculatus]